MPEPCLCLLLLLLAGLAAAEDSEESMQVDHTGATPRTAVAQVQLSLLRAELAASDAELEHMRSHLAILLRQLSPGAAAAAAGAAGVVGTNGAAGGSQLQMPEVDFLREVSYMLGKLSVRTADSSCELRKTSPGGFITTMGLDAMHRTQSQTLRHKPTGLLPWVSPHSLPCPA